MNIASKIELLESLRIQEEQAETNHSDMELIGLYEDIISLVKSIISDLLRSYSSGYIGRIIGNTKYNQIDNAYNKTMHYLYNGITDTELHDLSIPEDIDKLILKCYKAKDKDIFDSSLA